MTKDEFRNMIKDCIQRTKNEGCSEDMYNGLVELAEIHMDLLEVIEEAGPMGIPVKAFYARLSKVIDFDIFARFIESLITAKLVSHNDGLLISTNNLQ